MFLAKVNPLGHIGGWVLIGKTHISYIGPERKTNRVAAGYCLRGGPRRSEAGGTIDFMRR